MKLAAFCLLFGLMMGVAGAQEVQETKERVQKDFEQGFESLKLQVKDLQEKIRHSSGEVKKDFQAQLKNLEKDQKDLQMKISKLKKSSGSAWEDMKAGTSEAYDRFKKSVVQAKERFQEKETQ